MEHEERYKQIKAEILGEGSDDDESGSEESEEESEEEEEEGMSHAHSEGIISDHSTAVAEKEGIEDRTSTNLVNLRRVIYLTIMNALNY